MSFRRTNLSIRPEFEFANTSCRLSFVVCRLKTLLVCLGCLWYFEQMILPVSGNALYSKAAMTSWSIIFVNAVDCEVYHEFRTIFLLDFMLEKLL